MITTTFPYLLIYTSAGLTASHPIISNNIIDPAVAGLDLLMQKKNKALKTPRLK